MPRLERYAMEQAPAPTSLIDGVIKSVAQDVARLIGDRIGMDVAQQTISVARLQEAVKALEPSIKATLGPTLQKGFAGVEAKLEALAEDLKTGGLTQADMVKLQGDIVKALGRVKIPDYSEALRRLENRPIPTVDLEPIVKQLESMEFTVEQPEKWTFHVERDRNGLIKTVTAEADD